MYLVPLPLPLGIDEPPDKVNNHELIYRYGLLQGGSPLGLPSGSPSSRLKQSGKGSSKRSPLKSTTKEVGPNDSGSEKLLNRDPSVVHLSTSGEPTSALKINRYLSLTLMLILTLTPSLTYNRQT